MKTLSTQKDQLVSERNDLTSRQTQTCLPTDLTDNVPVCAHACILQWIAQTFPLTDCASTSNLQYLCTTHTPSGLTLGEASLQCVASDCASQVNNDLLLSAYKVCEGVDDAVPNTRTVISATVRPPAAAAAVPTILNAAPATFTPVPTTSANGVSPTTMIISADGTSVTMDPMLFATDFAATPTPTTAETGSTLTPGPTTSASSSGLSVSQIAGISSGTGVAALVVVGVAFFFFRRKRNARQNRLAAVQQISGPNTRISTDSATLTASPARLIGQDTRRSFWRKSIRPDEIGIAVPSKSRSRDSVSSEKSILRHLRSSISGQAASNWSAGLLFAPGNAATSPSARQLRDSISTVFDEDIEQQPSQPLSNTIYDRTVAIPRPLQLDETALTSPSLASSTTGEKSTALSLTPTYDNGQFSQDIRPPPVQNTIGATDSSTVSHITRKQTSRLSLEPGAKDASPPRNKLRKKSGASKAMISSPTSLYSSVSRPAARTSLMPDPLQPSISRPLPPEGLPKGIRQHRDILVRDGSSFMVTDSTSSDGMMSQYSYDWPVPPSLARSTGGFSASRGSIPVLPLNYARRYGQDRLGNSQSQVQSAQQQLSPNSPNSRARVTPTQKNSTGDLFFKVEMQ